MLRHDWYMCFTFWIAAGASVIVGSSSKTVQRQHQTHSHYYIATSDNTKLVHCLLMGGLLHLVQQRGNWVGPQPAQAPPRPTHRRPVSIIVLLYNGPLLCGLMRPFMSFEGIQGSSKSYRLQGGPKLRPLF